MRREINLGIALSAPPPDRAHVTEVYPTSSQLGLIRALTFQSALYGLTEVSCKEARWTSRTKQWAPLT